MSNADEMFPIMICDRLDHRVVLMKTSSVSGRYGGPRPPGDKTY